MSSLAGSIVVVIGGSSGIGLETARQAHAAGAKLVITGRNKGRLDAARDELGATAATLDLSDPAGIGPFFAGLPAPLDHVVVTGGGPAYSTIAEMDFDQALGVLNESGRLLGGELEHRREQLRATLPIHRVVEPADVAELVLTLMTNTALTGSTYDVDGGQKLI